jgi:uncharacterized lipoprotein YddW (UPF0748 family)
VEEKMVRKSLAVTFAAAVALTSAISGCGSTKPVATWQSSPVMPASARDMPPPAPREFRAAWVATVSNIDWPSKPGLPVAQQQAEIIRIVERARELNLNALILQVRTSADALYVSSLEPWSEYLTGTQGTPPSPIYDPLTMWIDEAHKRGIKIHAWFNPYRARHSAAKSPPARSHISNMTPAAVKSYGGFLWMDPGEPAAADQTLNVILDVVRRYDIDGVHMDDYFYPYPVTAANVPTSQDPAAQQTSTRDQKEVDFPDEPSWQRYLAGGGKLARADWRRQNVNTLIERIHNGIKREKSHVLFGVSPFGLGRPDRRPAGIAGFSQYDKLYADVELWLQRGWMDYLAPQLYWPIDQPPQAFGVLLDYWLKENTAQRHVWPGLYTTRINNTERSWQPQEIDRQIDLMRSRPNAAANAGGHIHFSMIGLMENRKGINDVLRARAYTGPALQPVTPWLGTVAPQAPEASVKAMGNVVKVKLTNSIGAGITDYALWARYGTAWRFTTHAAKGAGEISLEHTNHEGVLNAVVASAVDRLGNESARVVLQPFASKSP